MSNTGLESALKDIARRAWRDSSVVAVHERTANLVRADSTDRSKVESIISWVRQHNKDHPPPSPADREMLNMAAPFDADDAVCIAATMCLAIGIQCRIIGARYGCSWMCWLSYLDDNKWVDADVRVTPGLKTEPDEKLIAGCYDRSGDNALDHTLESERQPKPLVSGEIHVSSSVSVVAMSKTVSGFAVKVIVSGSGQLPPAISTTLSEAGCSKEQWELIKQLADRAWSEYERITAK